LKLIPSAATVFPANSETNRFIPNSEAGLSVAATPRRRKVQATPSSPVAAAIYAAAGKMRRGRRYPPVATRRRRYFRLAASEFGIKITRNSFSVGYTRKIRHAPAEFHGCKDYRIQRAGSRLPPGGRMPPDTAGRIAATVAAGFPTCRIIRLRSALQAPRWKPAGRI
jgi:hypothetical protein